MAGIFYRLHGITFQDVAIVRYYMPCRFFNHKTKIKMENQENAQGASDNVTDIANEKKQIKIIAFQTVQSETNNELNVEQSHEVDVLTSVTLNTTVTDTTASKVCGTVLNELFEFVNLQKMIGGKGLKLNEPINLKFEIGGQVINTAKWDKSLQAKLKLQNNAEGRRNFARKFWAMFSYTFRNIQEWDIKELQNVLEVEADKAVNERKAVRELAKAILIPTVTEGESNPETDN